MNQFSGKRYRPILRLKDLLHPIQQRERMQQFAMLDEPIGPYPKYSRLWTTSGMPALLLVRVPSSATRLSEDAYSTLIKQRVQWLIQTWMQDTSSGLSETQRLLEDYLSRLGEEAPTVPWVEEDINDWSNERSVSSQWREDWAEVLIGSDQFLEIRSTQGCQFPVQTVDQTHPEFQNWLLLHQDTDLETWLSLLSG